MAQSIGYSFSPTFENADLGKRGGSPSLQTQDAIQVLNFRLPKVVGAATANALSPLAGDARRGADFGGAVLQSVLRTVLGPEAGDAFAGSPAAAAGFGMQPRDTGASWLDQLTGGGGQIGDGGRNDSNDDRSGSTPYSPQPSSAGRNPPPSSAPPPVIIPGDDRPPTDIESDDDTPGTAQDVTPPREPDAPDQGSPFTPPSWRDDKYGGGGWGQDYQTL